MTKNSEMTLPDRIADSFSGKSIFITGGTGFIGKVLVEKILRRCPDVGIIYMLIRPKKGKTAKQRLVEMFSDDLFHLVRDMYSLDELSTKVTLIEGDISSEDLGLSNENKDLCSKTEIVIHSAACIRFDADLKESILLNTRGTKYVLELAKEFKKLELFVYMSTAYCHPEEKVLEEKAYKPRYDPHEMIRVVEGTEEHTLCALSPAILSDLPNTYTLSKALAEALVEEASNELPTLTLRPSVVIPILHEPLPGWTDNLNGPVGMSIAVGKGVLRTFYADDASYIDMIPVDVAVDMTMVAVWDRLKNGDGSRYINLTTSSEVIIPWSYILKVGTEVATLEVPLNNCLWAPGCFITKNKLLYNLMVIFCHWIPAVLIDILLRCFGYKPILLKVHNRISKGVEVVDYFVNNHKWIFKLDTCRQLRKLLNDRERNLYKLELEIDFPAYLKDCAKCSRLYLLKESEETLPAAQRHMARLRYLKLGLTVIFWCLLGYKSIPFAFGIFILKTLYERSHTNSKIVYKNELECSLVNICTVIKNGIQNSTENSGQNDNNIGTDNETGIIY